MLVGASLSATSYAITASRSVFAVLPGGLGMLFGLLEFVLLAGGAAAMFRFVPNTHVQWRHAWAGGLFVAVAFEVAKKALAWYVAAVQTYSVIYGAFATLPMFLLWIYLGWVIVLLGAVIAAYAPSLAMRRGAPARPTGAALRTRGVAAGRAGRGAQPARSRHDDHGAVGHAEDRSAADRAGDRGAGAYPMCPQGHQMVTSGAFNAKDYKCSKCDEGYKLCAPTVYDVNCIPEGETCSAKDSILKGSAFWIILAAVGVLAYVYYEDKQWDTK